MEQPILSIVIPTYNRYKYLYDCIKSTISVKSDELEIIVQDNTENNEEFVRFINDLNDPRVKYYHKAEHVSVIDNCDMGVGHSTGEYICMLGDDDTVCENIIKAAHFLKDNGIDGCCFPFPGFNWPDMTFEAGKEAEPNMFFRYEATGKYRYFDSRKELKWSLSHDGGLQLTMPRLYHGIVSKACVERVRAKTGTYFPGPSPDMANAVAVCLESRKTVYLSDYLIVSGYGKASARGEGNRNEHFGKIEEKPWLPKDVMEKWEKEIPQIFSGETIIAQSAIQSLRAMGCEKQYRYDFPFLYAEFYYRHKNVKKEYTEFLKASPKRLFLFYIGILKKVKKSVVFRLTKPKKYLKEYSKVETLMDAKRITDNLGFKGEYTKE